MTLNFSRISKTNLETSVWYLQGHFLKHPCFFLEQTNDRGIDLLFCVLRYLAHCTGLERLPELPQNKFCNIQITSNIYSFLLFPNNLLICIWKPLFLQNKNYAIFEILEEANWMFFQASVDNFCYVLTIFLYILWKYKYWFFQEGLCDTI